MIPAKLEAAKDIFPQVILQSCGGLYELTGAERTGDTGAGVLTTALQAHFFCELV